MKLKGRVFPCVMALIFCVIGVAILCLSISFFIEDARYAKTTATVISAEVGYSDDGKLTAVSTYEYYVDGERYVKKTAAQSANSAKYEGETFTVKYDPDDPASVSSGSVTPVIMLVLGLAFTILGGGAFLSVLTEKLN